jgi:hypothetical protein
MKKICALLLIATLLVSCGAKKSASAGATPLLTISGEDYGQLASSKKKSGANAMRLEIEEYSTARIKGILMDSKEGAPIVNAQLIMIFKNGKKAIQTDTNGYFESSLDQSIEKIKITHSNHPDLQVSLKDYKK